MVESYQPQLPAEDRYLESTRRCEATLGKSTSKIVKLRQGSSSRHYSKGFQSRSKNQRSSAGLSILSWLKVREKKRHTSRKALQPEELFAASRRRSSGSDGNSLHAMIIKQPERQNIALCHWYLEETHNEEWLPHRRYLSKR